MHRFLLPLQVEQPGSNSPQARHSSAVVSFDVVYPREQDRQRRDQAEHKEQFMISSEHVEHFPYFPFVVSFPQLKRSSDVAEHSMRPSIDAEQATHPPEINE